ncbi:MAG TPA: amidase [Pseudomonadales bacterium]|nr:amidase [Pseudomonadales bacterium]
MNATLTRRALLARSIRMAGAAALAGPLFAPVRALAAGSDAGDPYWRLDATAQAALVRDGQVSPLELVDAAIARIERIDGRINSVVTPLFEQARDRARDSLPDGPLRGVPWLVKDLDDLAGAPTSSGSRFASERAKRRSSPYVERALAGGVVPLGKSNTPEYGLIGTTESIRLGICRNPWDTDYTPGGSSGGAAAAVAAGLVPVAHATDGGGSIRIPASCCGLFGLKPSRGRLGPRETGPGADIGVQHCVSRSVRDSAAMFAIAEYRGDDAALPAVGLVRGPSQRRLRIAFSTRSYTGAAPHPDVEAATQRAAALCAELGHEVVEAAPTVNGAAFQEAFVTVWSGGAHGLVEAARESSLRPEDVFEPWTLGLAEHYEHGPRDAMARAIEYFEGAERIYDAFLERYDVVLTPVLAAPPVPIGAQAPTLPYDTLYERVFDWVAYTPIHNAVGTAAMSVPLGWSAQGLPIGIQFAAARGAERTLFELAYELEAAAPWADRWPTIATT